jgi:signal transduction histidine kinase
MDNKSKNFEKQTLILIPLLILMFALFNLIQGYSMIGKTFQGFSISFTLMPTQSTKKDWTGYSSNLESFDRIFSVNGIKIKNVKQLDKIIEGTSTETPVKYGFIRNNKTYFSTVNTMEFTMPDFISTFLLNFLITFGYLLMSLFIIIKGKSDEPVKALLAFTFLISISFCSYYDIELTHNFVAFDSFIQIFAAASLIHLGIIINKANFKDNIIRQLLTINLIISSILASCIVVVATIINLDLNFSFFLKESYFTLFYMGFYYITSAFIIFGLFIAYSYIKSPIYSLQKMQDRIILTGTILSFIPYIVFSAIPSMFGYKTSLENILLTFLAFPFFITYAIIRYKAFDIEVFIRRGLVYSTLSGILVVSYFSLSTLIVVVWQKFFNINDTTPIAFSAIFATIITSKLNKKVQTIIDKAFYRQKFDFTILLEKFINEIPKIFERNELINTCFTYLENTVNPVSVAFYFFDRQDNILKLLGAKNEGVQEEINLKSISSLNEISNVLNNYELTDSMILPLKKDQEIIGLLLLGKKKSEIEYLFEEKHFLNNFAVGTSMALDNLMLKEESFALSVKNIELENMAGFLNNLTANLSHDLKFPLSSSVQILNKISYLMEKKASISKDLIQDDISKLYKSLGKINEYISISLDREMISLGKLTLEKQLVNVRQACEDAISLHSDYLKTKMISIKFELSEEELFIKGDRVRFEHVVSNLISNAGKYGGPQITVKSERVNSYLLLIVEDNGSGIKEELKDKIFERYVQSGSGSNSGTDRSTGLGLFICKTYIEMMDGNIWFESGHGTKFFIKIPLLENNAVRTLHDTTHLKNTDEKSSVKISARAESTNQEEYKVAS